MLVFFIPPFCTIFFLLFNHFLIIILFISYDLLNTENGVKLTLPCTIGLEIKLDNIREYKHKRELVIVEAKSARKDIEKGKSLSPFKFPNVCINLSCQH